MSALAGTLGAWLVTTGWQASVLIVLVLAVQKLAGDRLAPRFRHALWLLVVLRLALPDLPAFPTSLFGLLPTALALPPRAQPVVPLLVSGWLIVAVFLAARIAWRAYRLTARVGPKRPVTRPDVIDLLEDCKQELGMHVPMTVVQSPEIASPALLGFLRPRLLLPERLLEAFDRDALRLLFLHEIAHAKRRDILVNWLATAVHVVHWWNPLVALAFARMRAEREMATDAAVLAREPEAAGRRYGETLIRLLEFSSDRELLPGTAGVLEDRSELERRVTMIAQHRRTPRRGTALFAGLVLALGLTTLTRAASPPETVAADASGTAAEHAFESWVAFVDAQDYARSWAEASPVFREGISEADWTRAAAHVHDALGAVVSRAPLMVTMTSSLDGAPDGQYAVVEYAARYQKVERTIERATLRLDHDGQWRIVGYFARPKADTSAAEKALGEWLAVVDAKDYGRSWDEAAPDLRAQIARGDWSQKLRAARGAYGPLVSRVVKGAQEHVTLPGARPGPYVIAQTNAAFERKAAVRETVTLQLAPDGSWRVVGYFIQ
jgi:beta-lactamase regulating signal transducer with metallopeptidase domain